MSTSIQPTIVNTTDILTKYQNKKILPIIVRVTDLIQNKKWILKQELSDANEWDIMDKDKLIGKIKVFTKKIIINMMSNDLSLSLNLGGEKENKQNLEIIKSL
jgi:hypothetical protein